MLLSKPKDLLGEDSRGSAVSHSSLLFQLLFDWCFYMFSNI